MTYPIKTSKHVSIPTLVRMALYARWLSLFTDEDREVAVIGSSGHKLILNTYRRGRKTTPCLR